MRPPPLQLLDHFALVHAVDVQMSPDGGQVAYLQQRADSPTDSHVASLWVTPAEGSATPVDLGPALSPRWSPDGRRLAFLRCDGLRDQIFIWEADSGSCRQLTHGDTPCREPTWSPDGSRIAYVRRVVAAPAPAQGAGLPRQAGWARPGVYTEALVRQLDGAPEPLKPGHHHVFVTWTATGKTVQLTQGPFDHGGPLSQTMKVRRIGRLSWTPDAGSIVMSLNRDDPQAGPHIPERVLDCDVYELDARSGRAQRLTWFGGVAGNALVSPDGAWIAFVGFRNEKRPFQMQSLQLLDRRSGELRTLAHPHGLEIHAHFEWAPDSRGVLVLYNEHGDGCLAHVALDGEWRVLTRDVGGSLGSGYTLWNKGVSVSRRGDVAYAQASARGPDEVALMALDGGAPRRITSNNDALLAERTLGRVDELWFESPLDGARIQAWLTYPPEFTAGRRYPLVVWLHGGPYLAWGPQFAHTPQWLAARGYLVLLVNLRGSLGYAPSMIESIEHRFPVDEEVDVLAAVDAVVAGGSVEESRIYVAGESAGGTLAAWTIGRTSRFAAAAIAYPAIDWASLVLTVDRPDFYPYYWFPAPPWEAGMQEHYWRRSPLSLVNQVTTPALLLCGEDDRRTPVGQAEMYYTALKLRGVDAALVVFPDEHHSFDAHPSHWLEFVAHLDRWFQRHTRR